MTDLEKTSSPGIKIEKMDDYYPSARVSFNGDFVLYAERDANLYDEQVWWDTNPALTREQILDIIRSKAIEIRTEPSLRVEKEFLRMGYSVRQTRENMGQEFPRQDLEYPLNPEGEAELRQNPIFESFSYLMATQKIEPTAKIIRENGSRIGGRIYFGVDTMGGGNWNSGDLFLVHCSWNLELGDISKWLDEIFKETSKFGRIQIGNGLQGLLT